MPVITLTLNDELKLDLCGSAIITQMRSVL